MAQLIRKPPAATTLVMSLDFCESYGFNRGDHHPECIEAFAQPVQT
jgi:hypothetical protein